MLLHILIVLLVAALAYYVAGWLGLPPPVPVIVAILIVVVGLASGVSI